jgi:hypothetical protein
MAHANLELIVALRRTAQRLRAGADYKWSHFGQCNCGHLAQTVTQLSARELQQAAFARSGDWGEQAFEYCPTSGYPVDYVLSRLFELGLAPEDMGQLERLSNDRVLKRLGVRELQHTRRDHVVAYMEAWAEHLAEALATTPAASAESCSRLDPQAASPEPALDDEQLAAE